MWGKTNDVTLTSLVGKVEWVRCHANLRDGLDIVFRVDGELRGFGVNIENPFQVFDAPQRRNEFRSVVLEPLDRERVLALVSFIGIGLLNADERQEWETLCEKDRREKEQRDARADEEANKRDRRIYEQLKKKFGEG